MHGTKFIKYSLFSFVLLFIGSAFISCGGDSSKTETSNDSLTSVSIAASVATIDATGSTLLTAVPIKEGSPIITYEWQITSGDDYASLSATIGEKVTLTGKNTTTSNQSVSVKVTAKYGSISKTATKTLSVKGLEIETKSLDGVVISGTTAIGATENGSLTATATYTGDILSEITYTWKITAGSDYATISGNGNTATITGKSTDENSSHDVTVSVTATYGTTTKTNTWTVKIQKKEVEKELTDLSLSANASSVAPNGTLTITPMATYTGSLTEGDFTVSDWEITAGSGYAVLKVPSTGNARSTLAFTSDNTSTLQANNTTTSSQTVTVSVKVSYGTVEKTATCNVTVQPSKVNSVSISGTTSISNAGTTDLTADVSKTGNPANVTYSWEITEGNEYATIQSGATSATATIKGTNTTSSSHAVTVKVTVSDGTNTVENTTSVTVEKDYNAESLYFPETDATDAYADTYLELTFDSAPTINRASSGTVRIYKADGTLVDTIKPATEKLYGYGVGGNSSYGEINAQYQLIQVIGNTVRIIPHHGSTGTTTTLLENGTQYYVLIDDGLITGTLGGSTFAGITDSSEWTFTTGAAPSVSGSTLTVGSDKQFITVQGALSYLMKNSKTGDWTIKIDSGTYYERIFYSGSANIILSGQGSATYGTDVEIQWCNQDGGTDTTLWNTGSRGRNVFYYKGGNLVLENLSLVNTATRKSNEYGEHDDSATSDNANGNNQAEALLFDSTGNCAAYNCNFTSKQDTVYLSPSGGKAWFYGCKISGDVDFIWGLSDVALFERCNIISAYDSDKSSNHTTYVVASHLNNSSAPYGKGFVLYNSTITTESGQTTYLARSPWGNEGNVAQVAIVDTAVTGGLDSSPWYGNHVGGTDETILGWKWYGVTSDGSAIADTYKISQSLYEAEFAGRNNIINRIYDGSAFAKTSSTWDVNTLASTRNWNVVSDSSKATLGGETETTSVVWKTSTASLSQTRNKTFYMYTDLTTTETAPTGDALYNYLYCDGSANDYIQGSLELYGTAAIYVPVTTSSTATITFTKGEGTLSIAGIEYTATGSAEIDCSTATLATLNGIQYIEVRVKGTAGGSNDKYWITNVVVTTSELDMGDSGDDYTGSTVLYLKKQASSTAVATLTNGTVTETSAYNSSGEIYKYSSPNYYQNAAAAYLLGSKASIASGNDFTISATISVTDRNKTNTGSGIGIGYVLGYDATDGYCFLLHRGSGSIGPCYATSSGVTNSTNVVSNAATCTAYTMTFSRSGSTITMSVTNSSGTSLGSTTLATSDVLNGTTAAVYPCVTFVNAAATISSLTITNDTTSTTVVDLKEVTEIKEVTVDNVIVSDGGAITDSDTSNRSATLTISARDVPTGYAGVNYSTKYGSTSYTTKTVTTRSDLVTYAKAGGYFIIVDGMIDMTDGMLPSTGGGTTSALDTFVNSNSSYSTYSDWVAAYAEACSTISDDENSGSGNSSLYSALWTLSNAYKSKIQLVVKSNTIIVGKDVSSGIKGANISISGESNIALRNLIIQDAYDPFPHHEVKDDGVTSDGYNAQWDCITIQGDCSYIWIDHCTIQDTMTLSHVYTGGSTLEKWQTYDGLLDIKGTGANITVSYCKFKNHDKTSLIGSSDSEGSASTRLITYHHNYFYNCGQRLPMIRNTTMHLYNNYYAYSSGNYSQQYAVGVRKGSVVYAENNYFDSGITYAFSGVTTGTLYESGSGGTVNYDTVSSTASTLFSTAVNAYTYDSETVATMQTNLPSEAGTGAVTIN